MLRQGILEGKTEGGQVLGSDEQQKCRILPLFFPFMAVWPESRKNFVLHHSLFPHGSAFEIEEL